jgi:hypothetical protein
VHHSTPFRPAFHTAAQAVHSDDHCSARPQSIQSRLGDWWLIALPTALPFRLKDHTFRDCARMHLGVSSISAGAPGRPAAGVGCKAIMLHTLSAATSSADSRSLGARTSWTCSAVKHSLGGRVPVAHHRAGCQLHAQLPWRPVLLGHLRYARDNVFKDESYAFRLPPPALPAATYEGPAAARQHAFKQCSLKPVR